MTEKPIYLDYNASTPIAPEVRAVIQPLLSQAYGNPSSDHWAGREAAKHLVVARQQVAALLQAHPDEVVFTSGGSESNNAAIKGAVWPRLEAHGNAHMVCSAIEHPSVRKCFEHLVKQGATLTVLPVDRCGRVSPNDLRAALRPNTALVSVMHANNEVGTVQPIAELAAAARSAGALFHTDAAQSVGKIGVSVKALGVDLLTIAGHKLYAPKGVGALYIREGVRLAKLVHGAGHERGRRAGTENVVFAAALGAACQLALDDPCEQRLRGLRDGLWQRCRAAFGDEVTLLGHPEKRLPNTANIAFVGRRAVELLAACPLLAASAGAACHAGAAAMSAVLLAMGVAPEVGLGAVRFSVGRASTDGEIARVIQMLRAAVDHEMVQA